jgi:hypothetical protein
MVSYPKLGWEEITPEPPKYFDKIFNVRVVINSIEYKPLTTVVDKKINEQNSSSNFIITFKNENGKYANSFSLNDEVEVYLIDRELNEYKIFLGLIEDISFSGEGLYEELVISGRDYTILFQDTLAQPRIFKNQEVSDIVKILLSQNLEDEITVNNVNQTETIIEKITFNNKSLYDCINELAKISGYYFYINVDKDLHFEKNDSISTEMVFNNTNVLISEFKYSDADIYNDVTVYGDKQLTSVREEFIAQPGSVYSLDDRPHNVRVLGSPNIVIQPGGIVNVNNPEKDNVKYLVDYYGQAVIFTSGTAAGVNTGWTGSYIIIDYDRNSPIISIRRDENSINTYGKKNKYIVDRNIKDIIEANLVGNTFIDEHKDPKITGTLEIMGGININPGETCDVDIPFHNITSQKYMITQAKYNLTKENILRNNVLTLEVNKKIPNFIDYMKEHELRLRRLESADTDTSITNVFTSIGSLTVKNEYKVIVKYLGSGFYFNVPNHNKFNSPSSVLGPWLGGSTVIIGSTY